MSHRPAEEFAVAGSPWRKSSRSEGQNACVEVAHGPELVGVRDTKGRAAGILAFDRAQWTTFVRSAADRTVS